MSHTMEQTIHGTLWRVSRNPDLSGNVQIFNTKTRMQTEVPGELLVGLVAEFVRSSKITTLETTDDLEIFGLEP